jgi:hypothetical protein
VRLKCSRAGFRVHFKAIANLLHQKIFSFSLKIWNVSFQISRALNLEIAVQVDVGTSWLTQQNAEAAGFPRFDNT